MSLQLLPQWRGTRFPNGGYPYQDRKTGFKFDAMAGNIDDRIKDVRKHRMANPTLYPDVKDLDSDNIRQEIIDYMCNRSPELCQEGDADLSLIPRNDVSAIVQTQTCVNCGSATNAKPVMCVSCGGGKVKYWTCSCGMKI